MGAICEICNQDMLASDGCIELKLKHNGVECDRIKVGDDGDFFESEDATCGDCGAHYGHYHHLGCDCERCPICGGQLIGCDCCELI